MQNYNTNYYFFQYEFENILSVNLAFKCRVILPSNSSAIIDTLVSSQNARDESWYYSLVKNTNYIA